jgi:hypothetical protein
MANTDGHWITMNGRHVFIAGAAQGGVKERHAPSNVSSAHPEGKTIGGHDFIREAQHRDDITHLVTQVYTDRSRDVHPSEPIPPVNPAPRPRWRMTG